MSYGTRVETTLPFDEALALTRDALQAQGFGILTEIDLAATLKAKIGRERAPQVILGACNPKLADRALDVEPQIGLLLPCNVVVRQEGDIVVVEALDPRIMVQVTNNDELGAIADEAGALLATALDALR